MPEIGETCEFTAEPSCVHLHTNNDNDTVTICGINLGQENAAILSWLANGESTLKVEIKVDS